MIIEGCMPAARGLVLPVYRLVRHQDALLILVLGVVSASAACGRPSRRCRPIFAAQNRFITATTEAEAAEETAAKATIAAIAPKQPTVAHSAHSARSAHTVKTVAATHLTHPSGAAAPAKPEAAEAVQHAQAEVAASGIAAVVPIQVGEHVVRGRR